MGDQRTNNPNHLPEPDDLLGNVGDGPTQNPTYQPDEMPGQNEAPAQVTPATPENPTPVNDDPPPIS